MANMNSSLQPDIEPEVLTKAIEAYINWKIAVRSSAATLTPSDYVAERSAWSKLLEFPRYVTAEAMRLVNRNEEAI